MCSESNLYEQTTILNKELNANEKEYVLNDKKKFERKSSNDTFDTQMQNKSILNSQTGHFNNIDNTDDNNTLTDIENEKINTIKNQINNNKTFFELQQNNKTGQIGFNFEDKNIVINEDSKIEENYCQKIINNDSKNLLFDESSKDKNSNKLNEINDNFFEINKLDVKRKILERKNTENLIHSYKYKNNLLHDLNGLLINNNSNCVKEKKNSKKISNLENSNWCNYILNNQISNSQSNNSNSIGGLEEIIPIKSKNILRQITISQQMLKMNRGITLRQNSHLSFKSNSSNKNSVFTFQNLLYKDRESLDIGNSILDV